MERTGRKRRASIAVRSGPPLTTTLGLTEMPLISVSGVLVHGIGAWRPRIERFLEVFRVATGQRLFPGTLNVHLDSPLPIREEFRILGSEIGEPEQDLLFERCRINGIEAFRLRPFQPATGAGGHGDHILEIVCSLELRPLLAISDRVVIEFPRQDPADTTRLER